MKDSLEDKLNGAYNGEEVSVSTDAVVWLIGRVTLAIVAVILAAAILMQVVL